MFLNQSSLTIRTNHHVFTSVYEIRRSESVLQLSEGKLGEVSSPIAERMYGRVEHGV